MWREFWKGSLVSLLAYAAAVVIGLLVGLWFTLAAIPVFQVAWTIFCLIRIIQLRRSSENYGFSAGGLASSCSLLLAVVVFTQIV